MTYWAKVWRVFSIVFLTIYMLSDVDSMLVYAALGALWEISSQLDRGKP